MKLEHRTFAEIDLGKVLYNVKEIKKLLSPGVKFMAVVKADAYGHGAVQISNAICEHVDYLSVATISEALELKNAGIEQPIFILSETSLSNSEDVVRNGLVQAVYTLKFAKALSAAAVKHKKTAIVHMKVDTGMGRIGVSPDDAVQLFKAVSSLPNIKIEGVFTHLARAEEKNGFTMEQMKKFKPVIKQISSNNLICHAANSAGSLYHKDSHMDMVRIGLSMYGLYPPGGEKQQIALKPALEFKTRVVYLKKVPAATPLSYGSTYVTKNETCIATLPVGYADGLPRALSNTGKVLIGGKRFQISGRVCMDLTLVDVGDANLKVGDEVILIGRQGGESILADDVAAFADTISYEIICGIGKRVPRVYIK